MGKIRELIMSILTKILGFLLFLLVLAILNIIAPYIHTPPFADTVIFINNNLSIIFLISLFMLFGDIFHDLNFPLNLPAPLFNAFGSLFIVTFLFRVMDFVFYQTGIPFDWEKTWLTIPIYLLTFLITILVGYLSILFSQEKNPNPKLRRPLRKKSRN